MLIPSRSSAHTVHRKQEEVNCFVLKWEKEIPKQEGKGSNPHRLPKVHCKLARFRFISEPSPHRKTMKMQHFLEELHLPLGVSKIRSDRKILGRNEPTKVCLKTG